jgi:hypothetical protein
MCGEAVWSVVLKKEGENKVWLDNGELHTVANPDSLAFYHSRDGQELQGTAPSRTDYEKRGLKVPSRLDSEWLQTTPQNFETSACSDEDLATIDNSMTSNC